MIPIISNIREENNILKFDINNINFSCINALRRIILSEIPCIVFETSPYENNKSTININTTRFNNEIIKQRLSCIPINIDDENFPIEDYELVLDIKNTTNNMLIVTTEDFQIINIKSNKFLDKQQINSIFPPNNITGDYIEFLRLRPNLSDNNNGEHIQLKCKFSKNISKNNYCYNVASSCSYSCKQDETNIEIIWNEKEKELINENKTTEEIKYIKKDFMNLDAKRFYIKDSFNFILETIGIYSNKRLIELGCSIINKKIFDLFNNIKNNNNLIINSVTTMNNSYDIILEKTDYTIGKLIEYMFNKKFFEEEKILTYCGFIKKHPHDLDSILRISFKEDVSNDIIINYILECSKELQIIFNSIKKEFI